MRAHLIVMAIAVGLVSSAALAQQSPLDGPLAAPGGAPAAPKASMQAKPKPHKPGHRAKAKPAKDPATTQDAAVPHQAPGDTPAARPGTPIDALDLGMKWNGSNDGAAQTKFQSGPNTSSGSGAEVGMKLHF